MKRLAVVLTVLQFFVLTAIAADAPKRCTLCVGALNHADMFPVNGVPTLVTDVSTVGPTLNEMHPDLWKTWTLMMDIHINPNGGDPLLQIDQQTKDIVDWAARRGHFAAFGTTVASPDPALAAYAIKQLAVAIQGHSVADTIVLRPHSIEELAKLYESGAQAYFDVVLVDGKDVAPMAKWLAEHDPAKKIYALVTPHSPDTMFDLAQALADGASTAFISDVPVVNDRADYSTFDALKYFDQALAGDYAYDSTAKIDVLDAKGNPVQMPALTFVRGEDLRTVIVPAGDATAATIVSLPNDRFTNPHLVDAAGDRTVKDVGTKGGHYLIGIQPVKGPFLLTVDHAEKPQANVTKEEINVAEKRGITVEEIIRNHQAYKSFQESIRPKYIARDETKLRFSIGDGGDAIEATIAGDYFSDPAGRADWVWQDFYVNGVKWKYGKIPELPLIQPEKVTQLPLDIHLTNDYRYTFVRETDLLGYHTYEVRFEPPANAPASLPLYRGTVWIDAHTWARVRLSMIELHLAGEVLSNEERVDFQPFARGTNAMMTSAEVEKADPRTILWLPRSVEAQQVISAAGRANVVLRATDFTNFRVDPANYDAALQQASASDARMIRESQGEMKYLEKTPSGERVVKQGFDTARKFALGGIHHDAGLQFPVIPLAGIDYFNFDLHKTGIQTNVLYAGVFVAANATQPNLANTHTNVGADFFGIAVPTTNAMYRNGEEVKSEDVKQLPVALTLRAGHPVFQFGKIDVSLGLSHVNYSRTSDTAADFLVPSNTFEISPSVDGEYSRWGTTISGFYTYTKRSSWRPWGNLAEYNPDQKSFTNFGGGIGKSFYLPKFQRISVQLNYLDGQRTDRFSGYELGFFGTSRVHGVRSGSVHADRMFLGHLSYGFVISDQFRLEGYYDHALVTDRIGGYSRKPFQGVGLGGQTVGPWGTLLRLDVGKTVGQNRQSGFVADVIVLKLF